MEEGILGVIGESLVSERSGRVLLNEYISSDEREKRLKLILRIEVDDKEVTREYSY